MQTIKNSSFLILILALILAACGRTTREQKAVSQDEVSHAENFMHHLSNYCGQTLDGEIFADQAEPANNGNPISFQFENCTDNEIRISVVLPGEERKTIILTQVDNELLLKHDIRNVDHSPSMFTMYGGFANNAGNENKQIFPVHNFGRDMWPGYENYSWEICISEETGLFEYMEMNDNIVRKHFIAKIPS